MKRKLAQWLKYICGSIKMKSIFSIALFCALFSLSSSCVTEPDCIIVNTSAIKIDFKQRKLNRTTNRTSVVDTALSFRSIRVSGLPRPINVADTTVRSLTLPINPNVDTVRYSFIRNTRTGSTVNEFITFSFDSETRVISTKCGAFPFFLNLQIEGASYGDSQIVQQSNRLLKDVTNVQVFF